jgi:hypothetical protein
MTIQELKQHWKNLPRDLANLNLRLPPWVWPCLGVISFLSEVLLPPERYWHSHWDSFMHGLMCGLALLFIAIEYERKRQRQGKRGL